jgi:hypothetical protein
MNPLPCINIHVYNTLIVIHSVSSPLRRTPGLCFQLPFRVIPCAQTNLHNIHIIGNLGAKRSLRNDMSLVRDGWEKKGFGLPLKEGPRALVGLAMVESIAEMIRRDVGVAILKLLIHSSAEYDVSRNERSVGNPDSTRLAAFLFHRLSWLGRECLVRGVGTVADACMR